MDALLRSMLDDHRLSRSERRAIRELVTEQGLSDRELGLCRRRVFDLARAEVDGDGGVVIDWLEDAVKSLLPPKKQEPAEQAARFSPGHDCLNAIVGEFRRARRSVEVCVFTITDDRIVEAMLDCHERGIRLRVITDDDKSHDLGSDADRLARVGVPVRMDNSPSHMHHKFALFDGERLLTGSYNWTRSAAERNHENLVLSENPELARAFHKTFERLWARFE